MKPEEDDKPEDCILLQVKLVVLHTEFPVASAEMLLKSVGVGHWEPGGCWSQESWSTRRRLLIKARVAGRYWVAWVR